MVASYHPAMAAAFPITRRLFLVDLGRAGVAVTVLGLAGCATIDLRVAVVSRGGIHVVIGRRGT